ncbi:MAG: NifU family protein [Acidimicrobiales bacterium]
MDEPVTIVSKPEHSAAADSEPDSGPPSFMRAGVEEAIDAIRPALQMDGGDVTLLGVDETTGVVEIELIGACVGCPASTMTLKAGIERILKDRVEGITEVNAPGLEPAFEG